MPASGLKTGTRALDQIGVMAPTNVSKWRTPLWERQIDLATGKPETERAYDAFLIYLNMSVYDRSLRAVDAELRRRAGKPPRSDHGAEGRRRQHVSRWLEECCSRWGWVERVRAFQDQSFRCCLQAHFDRLYPGRHEAERAAKSAPEIEGTEVREPLNSDSQDELLRELLDAYSQQEDKRLGEILAAFPDS